MVGPAVKSGVVIVDREIDVEADAVEGEAAIEVIVAVAVIVVAAMPVFVAMELVAALDVPGASALSHDVAIAAHDRDLAAAA